MIASILLLVLPLATASQHNRRLDADRRRQLQTPAEVEFMMGEIATFYLNVTRDYPGGTPVEKNVYDYADASSMSGRISGRRDSHGIERYFGIPVAMDTSGPNRFQHAIAGRTWTGTMDAVEEKVCSQYGVVGTEDCVSVDVITRNDLSNVPVACWIHGGGFSMQDFGYPATRGNGYYAKSGIIKVNMHYRLGILGWGAFPQPNGGVLANFGFSDVIANLKWVKGNIVNFGGNNNKVTIFGESAGGAFVAALIASPLVTNLIQGAIAQSPFIAIGDASFSPTARMQMTRTHVVGSDCTASTSPWAIPNEIITNAELICMRSWPDQPPMWIGSNSTAPDGTTFDEYHTPGAPPVGASLNDYSGMIQWPVVDGLHLTMPPKEAYRTGVNAHLHVMVGHNADELITFYKGPTLYKTMVNDFDAAPFPVNVGENDFNTDTEKMGDRALITANSMLPVTATSADITNKILELTADAVYNSNIASLYTWNDDPALQAIQKSTDSWLGGSTMGISSGLQAAKAAGLREAGTYKYLYAQPTPEEMAKKVPGIGACHGCELTYVLGMYEQGANYPMTGLFNSKLLVIFHTLGLASYDDVQYTVPFSAREILVGTVMKTFWMNFFNTGNPNGGGAPTWADSGTAGNVMVFNQGFAAAAAQNPCVQNLAGSVCHQEPAMNFRSVQANFWNSGVVTGSTPTCASPAINKPSLSYITGMSCPDPCACSSTRALLFGVPTSTTTRPAGCPVC